MPIITWEREDRIRDIASGLETGEMSRTYAASLLRVLLSEVRVERHKELNDPARIAFIEN